ncbi:MAG: hypothetical protein HY758_01820 [Nitrospirae bacterium]|nr:hypothetical protein [Nitrospirota bacterium]
MIKKIGIMLVLIGICLPTATLPFIIEYHPDENMCFSSNYFSNLGNMQITFGHPALQTNVGISGKDHGNAMMIPYKFAFSSGVILFLTGIGMIMLAPRRNRP